jgi:hypothetical protein
MATLKLIWMLPVKKEGKKYIWMLCIVCNSRVIMWLLQDFVAPPNLASDLPPENHSNCGKLARWPALIARQDLIKLSLYITHYSSF